MVTGEHQVEWGLLPGPSGDRRWEREFPITKAVTLFANS
jgi:hypothetical protein